MAEGPLSIKLRCASWQQLATIYKRDLSQGTLFLRANTPPPVGTSVRIDLTLPSASVIVATGVVQRHVEDPQRGAGVEIQLAPLAPESVWMIESALASEHRRLATPARGTPILGPHQITSQIPTIPTIPTISAASTAAAAAASHAISGIPAIPAIHDSADVTAAEQGLIRALVSEAESLKKLNPFLVLGVGYEATDSEVRASFGELTKRYHPDRFARYESEELRQVAAEIFILIRDAYRRLADAAGRAAALQALGKAAPAPRAVPGPTRPQPAVPSPRAFQRSTAMPPLASTAPATPTPPTPTPHVSPPAPSTAPASASAPRPAPTATRRPADPPAGAVGRAPGPPPRAATEPPVAPPATAAADRRRATPTQGLPVEPLDAAAIEELIDQARLDEALAAFRAAVKRHPTDRNLRAGVELCEGLRALAARDRLEAAQRFETALEIDPSNERAARELADMRRQATNERKGLLSRLMGKKES